MFGQIETDVDFGHKNIAGLQLRFALVFAFSLGHTALLRKIFGANWQTLNEAPETSWLCCMVFFAAPVCLFRPHPLRWGFLSSVPLRHCTLH